MNAPSTVTISTPATSANLGPGFDSFGLALGLTNWFRFTLAREGGVRITVGGRFGLPPSGGNAALDAFTAAARSFGMMPPEHCHLEMDIALPLGRGLGSSATARVAGVLAAHILLRGADRSPAIDAELAVLAARLEGHPDNVLPCLFGGLIIAASGPQGLSWLKVPMPRPPGLAVLIPHALEVATDDARRALPKQISHGDAVFSAHRAGLLAAALASGQLAILGVEGILEDRLHEPTRGALIPGFLELRQKAREAGAYGLVISGSGPSLLILAADASRARAAGEAAREAWAQRGVAADLEVPEIDEGGARVIIEA